jgi:hypothetical protein
METQQTETIFTSDDSCFRPSLYPLKKTLHKSPYLCVAPKPSNYSARYNQYCKNPNCKVGIRNRTLKNRKPNDRELCERCHKSKVNSKRKLL